jgi:DNA-binding transcriptional ArsR family regulator
MQIRNDSQPEQSPDLKPLFRMHAELCRALANEHRQAILHAICNDERCVSDLAAEIGISVHNVSQHLRVLKERRLVSSRKEGQSVYYRVTNMKFMEACALIRQALVEQHLAQGESLQAAEFLDARQPSATPSTPAPSVPGSPTPASA